MEQSIKSERQNQKNMDRSVRWKGLFIYPFIHLIKKILTTCSVPCTAYAVSIVYDLGKK